MIDSIIENNEILPKGIIKKVGMMYMTTSEVDKLCDEILASELGGEMNTSERKSSIWWELDTLEIPEDRSETFKLLEEIYIEASNAIKENPNDKTIIIPYVEKLLSHTIDFTDAYELDNKYFGCSGSFWRSAYDYPYYEDKIPLSRVISKPNVVTSCGLLTFDVSYTKKKVSFNAQKEILLI